MIDELYKEGRDYEYFIRMREAEMQNEAYRQSEQEAKEIIAELKQENESLKKGNETFKDSIHKLLQVQYKLADNCKKYSKVLEEIMEIANNAKNGRYTTKSKDYTEGMEIIGGYVLNIINEVLKNED